MEISEIKKTALYTVLILIIMWAFSRSCSNTPPPEPPSQTTIQTDIIRALAANKISECGDFEFSLNPGRSSEYIVKCTSDGKNYTTYTVWPKIGKVMRGAQ